MPIENNLLQEINLTLIIPCYNEEIELRKSVKKIEEALDKTKYTYEMIFIDDYSTDNTREIINNICKDNPKHRYYLHNENIGRGSTVAEGIRLAKGKIVGFIDIDLSTDPWYILPLVTEIEKGFDIVIANRVYKLKWKVLPRWILSKGYKFLVKIFLNLDLGDTESGCKFFNRKKIIPILSQVKDKRWFWDTEIIVRSYIAGLEISEIPTVFIREFLYSRVNVLKDSWRHFVNLIRFSKEIKNINSKK